MKKNVHLITFHASHNFGSVMQAYALKHTVENMGHCCEIINFRPTAQVDKYSVIPRRYGWKAFARGMLNYVSQPFGWRRTHRAYESFITCCLTDAPPLHSMEDLHQLDCDVLLTGSDQVWGFQIPEFVKSSEDIRPAYYFSFAQGKKVAYAASTGTATSEQLAPYSELMSSYASISVREKASVDLVSGLSGAHVSCVLDPTFLLSASDYRELIDEQCSTSTPVGGYCLIYSLQGYSARSDWLALASKARSSLGIPVISVSHFIPLRGRAVHPVTDIGPIETLELFANAEYVLTDTFHGTLFATHFRKQFVTFTPRRKDPRIMDITTRLGLSERVAQSIEDGLRLLSSAIDYERVEETRSVELAASLGFLSSALGD